MEGKAWRQAVPWWLKSVVGTLHLLTSWRNRNQEVNRRWDWVIKPQGWPPLSYFFQQGPTCYRSHGLSEYCHWVTHIPGEMSYSKHTTKKSEQLPKQGMRCRGDFPELLLPCNEHNIFRICMLYRNSSPVIREDWASSTSQTPDTCLHLPS